MIVNRDAVLPDVIFLMGPTSSGKTTLSLDLAKYIPIECVSVDSALIYRGMNIGTAKPLASDLETLPHRLLDIRDPSETYSVARFLQDVVPEIEDIIKKDKIPLLVGGTMLYFKTLVNGLNKLPPASLSIRRKIQETVEREGLSKLYNTLLEVDPISARRIHPNDSQRLSRALEVYLILGRPPSDLEASNQGYSFPYNIYQFAIAPRHRELLHQRIEVRFNHMLASGFEEEVKLLFSRGDLHTAMPSIRCIGYRQMWAYLSGYIDYDSMVSQGVAATRQLAKRQISWLRKWKELHWLDSGNLTLARDTILKIISSSY
jgi:tRNA dimethylallyltransferase